MKDINSNDTDKLLLMLDNEINRKCSQLKKQQSEEKLKRTFLISCGLFLLLFIIQIFLKLFNMDYVTSFVIFEGLIVIAIIPMFFNAIKGGILNDKI